ncbi:MAG: NosD domain-containing protein, partial [Bacteroidia bacterium]
IYFEFANYCLIENNLSEENLRYGLHFMNSNHDNYMKNIFRNNGTGVAVMYSKYIYMMYNTFELNRGDASYALLLKTISYGIICGNKFENNTAGIFMDETNALKISRNVFEKNGWAVKLLSNCMQDTFTKNNFIANTFDVSTNGTLYNNYFKNNYWDKYEGYDLNKDNFGDVPYRPVSMYSVILEQIPQAGVLMRSIMVDLLDKVEKIIPSLIPELLKDVEPVMKQNKI